MDEPVIREAQIAAPAKAGQRRAWGRTPLDLPLALFTLSAFVGLWAAYDRSLSWPLLITLLGCALLYLALTWPGLSTTTLRGLAWVLLLAQAALALYFITQFKHLDYPVKLNTVARLGRLTGSLFPALGNFYPQPNALATFIEGGLPLAAGLWWSARQRWERLAAGLAFLVLGYGLLLTVSRGAWLAVAACAGLTLVVWGGRRLSTDRRVWGLAGLVGLALAAAVGVTLIAPQRVPALASALLRGQDRIELYKNSLHLIRDYPLLGIGLGDTFAMVYSKYVLLIPHPYFTYAHNLPLAIWLNQGLLGLAGFGWLVLAFYGLVLGQARRGQGSPLFWGAALGVTAMLLHGLTDAPQYANSRWVMPVFFALLGLSVASWRITNQRMANQRIAFMVLIVVVLGVTVVLYTTGALYANLGAIEHARADLAPALDDGTRQQTLDRAVHYYERALEMNKGQPAAHWRLGLIDLNADRFPQAIEHLETARAALPDHRGVQKALGYAYLWDGQIARAEELLRPLDEVYQELGTWRWWRGEQGQNQLADYAQQLELRFGQAGSESVGE
jgi:putative inorganic carbon (HCO3(-)) transporter